MNPSLTLTTAVICCCLGLILQEVEAAPSCTETNKQMTDEEASQCNYGVKTDWCRNDVCAKGPGQRCGGTRMVDGVCGDAMFCSCQKCVGCSVRDGKCYRPTPICTE